ncbi:hypothetical protein SBRCBS47491_004901 [Sporothrix bragantina]|uniref:4'-phosphopantetheinyl transferase domain-containing protein n=1 Tax=Sporothrix bragantina TaxID=671064 RepID=A0ABP0BSC4_9PEZI
MSAHAAVAWLARGHALPSSLPASKPDALPDAYSPLWRAAQYLAGRFAAKEAAIKAHPHLRELTLQDVRIARRGIGEGQVESEGEGETDAGAQEHLARKGTGPPLAFVRVPSAPISEGNDEYVEQEARISISHDGEYATAVCLGVEHAS